jgi:hypothetical protein
VDQQNPTHVAILMDVADMDVLMGMQTEEAAEAMAYDGSATRDIGDSRRGIGSRASSGVKVLIRMLAHADELSVGPADEASGSVDVGAPPDARRTIVA